MMAAELRTSREKVEQSRRDLEQKNLEVDARRRYIETILERVATGVMSLDAEGRLSTINGAAERLLGLDLDSIGRPAADVFRRAGSDARSCPLLETIGRGAGRRRAGSDARARRSGNAPGRRSDGARRRAWAARRQRARARRRDAAHSRAARRGVARRGAPARARDQESADAHSAERRAPAAPFRRRPAARRPRSSSSAPTRSSPRWSRSKASSTSSRSSRGCAARACCPNRSTRVIEDTLQLYASVLQSSRLEIERRVRARICRPCASTRSRCVRSSSISSTMRWRRSADRRRRRGRTDRRPRITITTARDIQQRTRAARRERQRARRAARRPGQAVHAVLLDQGTRERARPGDRPADCRRARRRRLK